MDGGTAPRTAAQPPPDPRTTVARLVSRHGPVTASTLAVQLGVTPAAVRRHLDSLAADGLLDSRDVVAAGRRGRGRPARAFVLSRAGHDRFDGARTGSEPLAADVLRFLEHTAGRSAVAAFARERAGRVRDRAAGAVAAAGPDPGRRVAALASVLDADGFAASTRPAAIGIQLCQGQCPVHRIAAEFPELCEAEAAAFAEVLGTPVQRLATLAGGAHVCTTHVTLTPGPVPAAGRPIRSTGQHRPRNAAPHTDQIHDAPRDDRTGSARPGTRTLR